MLFEDFVFGSNDDEKTSVCPWGSKWLVTLNPLVLSRTWGRSHWCMVFRGHVQLCIRTLGIRKMLVRRCPVFVRLFLFPFLFLYHSFSILLLSDFLVWLFSGWFLGFLGTIT
jgi:hypothetical protein